MCVSDSVTGAHLLPFVTTWGENAHTHTHTHTQGAPSARRIAPENGLVARREVLGPENVAVPATTNVTRLTKASKPAIVSSRLIESIQ